MIKQTQAHLNLEIDGVHASFVQAYNQETNTYLFNIEMAFYDSLGGVEA